MSQFGNLPEVVIYIEFGQEHKALVFAAHSLEHHDGENDEPMLDLVIVAPVVADECAKCGNPAGRHNVPMPPGNHFSVCEAFVAPQPKQVVDPDQLVQIKHGVPHESHAFTDKQLASMQNQGINVAQVYPGGAVPGGRWREVAVPVAAIPIKESEAVRQETVN